ncbi:MAG: hypothetical protein Q4D73_06325 [Actinomycetaceae bacterium]|nr:hypothetical protein [Actinomycetaceae bacterium]
MKANFTAAAVYIFFGSFVALVLAGVASVLFPVNDNSLLGLAIVGVPGAIALMVLFGILALLMLVLYRGMEFAEINWTSLLMVLGVGALVGAVAGILYAVDSGPGFNFGFGFAMGAIVPVVVSFVVGTIILLVGKYISAKA